MPNFGPRSREIFIAPETCVLHDTPTERAQTVKELLNADARGKRFGK